MIARVSTLAGDLGAADVERDVRGFALKFHTGEGNRDLVGNSSRESSSLDMEQLEENCRTRSEKQHGRKD